MIFLSFIFTTSHIKQIKKHNKLLHSFVLLLFALLSILLYEDKIRIGKSVCSKKGIMQIINK